MAGGRKGVVGLALAVALALAGHVRAAGSDLGFDLVRAASEGDASRVKALIAQGADVNYRNPRDPVLKFGTDFGSLRTPLLAAASRCRLRALRILAAEGAKMSAEEATYTLCGIAGVHFSDGRSDCPELVPLLIRWGADVEGERRCGDMYPTPLLLAARESGKAGIIQELLKGGARVEAVGMLGMTPLGVAAGHSADYVGILLKAGADPNRKDGTGRKPLEVALAHDQLAVVEVLRPVTKGSLMSAEESRRRLLADQEEPQSPDDYLLQASSVGDWEAVATALDHGAKPRGRDPSGLTVLINAAMGGRTGLVKRLVAAGSSVNERGPGGVTPLIAACRFGHVRTAVALIARGAEVGARDEQGKSAEDWARSQGHTAVVDMFRKLERQSSKRR